MELFYTGILETHADRRTFRRAAISAAMGCYISQGQQVGCQRNNEVVLDIDVLLVHRDNALDFCQTATVALRCFSDLSKRVGSVNVSRRGAKSSARDSLAISRRIYAFTITPHSSLHRWQYRAPQGRLPLLGLSRISLLLRLYSAVIPCALFCILHLFPAAYKTLP